MKNLISIAAIIILIFKTQIISAQDVITLKTSEIYRVEFPNKAEYQSGNYFVTWNFYPKHQAIEIDYEDEKMKDMNIFYQNDEVLEKSENSIKVNYEGETEFITLIMNNNYIKIKVQFNEVENSNPREFKNVHVFTNYNLENIFGILSDKL